MSHSNPFNPDARPIADEDGESMDSIPWESLDTLAQARDHRRWYVIAAGIVVIAVGISAARNLGIGSVSSPDPVPVTAPLVAVPVATAPEGTEPTPTTTAPSSAVVTEADLMAIEPPMLERSAATFAEVAAVEYFTGLAEGIWTGVEFDRSRSTFVEYATAVEVTHLSPLEFEVLVAVSVLDAPDDGAYVRRPVRGISIVVDASDDQLRPARLPSPATLPFHRLEPASTDPLIPDADLLATITRAGEEFGEVRSVEYRQHPSGGGTATVTIVDAAGIGWPMDLEVESDGSIRSTD